MSLTSYRAAPPRVKSWSIVSEKISSTCALQTWQRPTLPRLETKYHRRWGVSRPCSEWERVQPPRQNHQVGKAQINPDSALLSGCMRSWGDIVSNLIECAVDCFSGSRSVCSARPEAVAPCGARRPQRL